jgi:hypothetical protein
MLGDMSNATSSGLLRQCMAAIEAGKDFPTIWHSILKGHPLVTGVPVQADLDRLEIRLLTHQNLVFDSAAKTFSIA